MLFFVSSSTSPSLAMLFPLPHHRHILHDDCHPRSHTSYMPQRLASFIFATARVSACIGMSAKPVMLPGYDGAGSMRYIALESLYTPNSPRLAARLRCHRDLGGHCMPEYGAETRLLRIPLQRGPLIRRCMEWDSSHHSRYL